MGAEEAQIFRGPSALAKPKKAEVNSKFEIPNLELDDFGIHRE